jgi:hypothetical protein
MCGEAKYQSVEHVEQSGSPHGDGRQRRKTLGSDIHILQKHVLSDLLSPIKPNLLIAQFSYELINRTIHK